MVGLSTEESAQEAASLLTRLADPAAALTPFDGRHIAEDLLDVGTTPRPGGPLTL
jgi:hypothetical protein